MMEHHFKLQRGGKTHLNINQTASGGLSGVYRSDRVPRPECLCHRTFSVPPQRDRCDEARCTSGFGWSTNRSAQQSMGNSSPLNAEERLLYFLTFIWKERFSHPHCSLFTSSSSSVHGANFTAAQRGNKTRGCEMMRWERRMEGIAGKVQQETLCPPEV